MRQQWHFAAFVRPCVYVYVYVYVCACVPYLLVCVRALARRLRFFFSSHQHSLIVHAIPAKKNHFPLKDSFLGYSTLANVTALVINSASFGNFQPGFDIIDVFPKIKSVNVKSSNMTTFQGRYDGGG